MTHKCEITHFFTKFYYKIRLIIFINRILIKIELGEIRIALDVPLHSFAHNDDFGSANSPGLSFLCQIAFLC